MDLTLHQWALLIATAHPLFWSHCLAFTAGMMVMRRVTRWTLGGRL